MKMNNNNNSKLIVKVVNEELWKKFNEYGNEMIIVKSGRKIFPRIAFQFENVDPNSSYGIALSILRIDNYRYKFEEGKWIRVGNETSEPEQQVRTVYHPDGFIWSGEQLSRSQISFDRIGLTNDVNRQNSSNIELRSMHKYRPVLTITRLSGPIGIADGGMSSNENIIYSNPVMDFIAVTAYQNHHIINLKNEHNPYAKGQKLKRNIEPYSHEHVVLKRACIEKASSSTATTDVRVKVTESSTSGLGSSVISPERNSILPYGNIEYIWGSPQRFSPFLWIYPWWMVSNALSHFILQQSQVKLPMLHSSTQRVRQHDFIEASSDTDALVDIEH